MADDEAHLVRSTVAEDDGVRQAKALVEAMGQHAYRNVTIRATLAPLDAVSEMQRFDEDAGWQPLSVRQALYFPQSVRRRAILSGAMKIEGRRRIVIDGAELY